MEDNDLQQAKCIDPNIDPFNQIFHWYWTNQESDPYYNFYPNNNNRLLIDLTSFFFGGFWFRLWGLSLIISVGGWFFGKFIGWFPFFWLAIRVLVLLFLLLLFRFIIIPISDIFYRTNRLGAIYTDSSPILWRLGLSISSA